MPEIPSSELPSSAALDGPFFFAWADEGEAFDAEVHARFDDDIFEFHLEHNEGDFPTLNVTVKNPRVGLLAPGRKRWAWFSYYDGTIIKPLFFGRLVGLPEQIHEELINLAFIARPSNYAEQKVAVAAPLKVRPYWDSIWFDNETRDDPDNILESRPALWHVDRVTHEVTISDIASGEDGNLAFGVDDAFYDSLRVTYGQNPLRAVQMTATVSWDQSGKGTIPIMPGPGGGLVAPSGFKSFTGGGLVDAWPKDGQNIGGGWFFARASATAAGNIDSSLVGQIIYPPPFYLSAYADGGFDTSFGEWGRDANGSVIGYAYHVAIPNVTVTYTLALGWEATRRKGEILSFTVKADVQDLLTDIADEEVLALALQSSEINGPIDPAGAIPLKRQDARYYFTTARGVQSIEYLLAVARANLVARARACNVEFEIPFDVGIASDLSCRKNASVTDPRLPGGSAVGKIKGYFFSLRDGQQTAGIALGVLIGRGGAIVVDETGTPDYCETDYVDGEEPSGTQELYQTYTGQFVSPFIGELKYESIFGKPCNDDGIDLARIGKNTIKQLQLFGGNGLLEDQEDALARFIVEVDENGQVQAENFDFAYFELVLPNLQKGPFETNYPLTVSELKIPAGIDLEASAT